MKKTLYLLLTILVGTTLQAAPKTAAPALDSALQARTQGAQQQSILKQINMYAKRLVRIQLTADFPNRRWQVYCSGFLEGGNALVMDNPCTEILATAFTEQAPVSISVSMDKLGRFSSGPYKGKDFFYQGSVLPNNFKVLKNGYTLYNIPSKEKEAQKALASLPQAKLSEQNLTAIFKASLPPSSIVRAPQTDKTLKYKKADVAPFKAFLTQLEKDIAAHLKRFGVTAEIRDCSGSFNEPFIAKGYITDPRATVILTAPGATDEGTAYQYLEDVKRSGYDGEPLCLYITMPGLGKYTDGKAFYFSQPPMPVSQFWLAPVEAFGFVMNLPKGKPVFNTLHSAETQKAFNQSPIANLWLENYGPRIQRAMDMLP